MNNNITRILNKAMDIAGSELYWNNEAHRKLLGHIEGKIHLITCHDEELNTLDLTEEFREIESLVNSGQSQFNDLYNQLKIILAILKTYSK